MHSRNAIPRPGHAPGFRLLCGSVLMLVWLGWPTSGAGAEVICAQCEARVPDKALFCTACGHAASAQDGIFCWRCGLKMPAKVRFCSRCGSEACTEGVAERRRDTSTSELGTVSSTRPSAAANHAPADRAAPATSTNAVSELRVDDAPTNVTPRVHPWSRQLPDASRAVASQAKAGSAEQAPADESNGPLALINYPVSLRPDGVLLPPRLFDSPTGDILPSLGVHAGGGLAFGFSDQHERTERWVLSFGLGGAGEAVIASSNIIHIAVPESQPLLGLRLRVPVAWVGDNVREHLTMAFNVAATGDNTFKTTQPFFALDDRQVNLLRYKHRETTMGVAGTWKLGRTRLHGIVHWTDLRFEDVQYEAGAGLQAGLNEKDVHTSFGLGLDFEANAKTYFLAELRTAPQLDFIADDGKIEVASQTEYTMGLRFFLDPVLALDANVNIDDEALGLADMEIGFGVHLILEPRRTH